MPPSTATTNTSRRLPCHGVARRRLRPFLAGMERSSSGYHAPLARANFSMPFLLRLRAFEHTFSKRFFTDHSARGAQQLLRMGTRLGGDLAAQHARDLLLALARRQS